MVKIIRNTSKLVNRLVESCGRRIKWNTVDSSYHFNMALSEVNVFGIIRLSNLNSSRWTILCWKVMNEVGKYKRNSMGTIQFFHFQVGFSNKYFPTSRFFQLQMNPSLKQRDWYFWVKNFDVIWKIKLCNLIQFWKVFPVLFEDWMAYK